MSVTKQSKAKQTKMMFVPFKKKTAPGKIRAEGSCGASHFQAADGTVGQH